MSKEKIGNTKANQTKYPFVLPDLPYPVNALEPYMSANTFSYHHEKHHNAYVQNLNKLLAEHELKNKDLEEIIFSTAGDTRFAGIFNNAAQVWNHTFFWHSMRPNGGGKPSGSLLLQINQDFGSYEEFLDQMKAAGATQFGSGWAWLVFDLNDTKLKVTKTANAENPMIKNQVPLLTCDVWEHAYYLDYQNRRPDYINIFLSELVNWEFAEKIFEQHHGNKKA
jgi:superoxide dismutase, Fe-Mn family